MSSPAKTAVKTYQNYINGQWVSSSEGETFPVFDPSTEEVIAHVAAAKCERCRQSGEGGARGV
jgi:acyl-CoA reductase-like NAD-dependent aldehyde dehydrogenase